MKKRGDKHTIDFNLGSGIERTGTLPILSKTLVINSKCQRRVAPHLLKDSNQTIRRDPRRLRLDGKS